MFPQIIGTERNIIVFENMFVFIVCKKGIRFRIISIAEKVIVTILFVVILFFTKHIKNLY